MIVVLADDLTGAAELGGVASRYGLDARVRTDLCVEGEGDLIVLDTDTRGKPAQEAERRVRAVAQALRDTDIEWAYKKVDSVLRGHVLVELTALLEGWGKRRAVLVSANPALGRTVTDGRYRVGGRLLHQTDFARDPMHPATTSDVTELLRVRDALGAAQRWPVIVMSPPDRLPERGIVVGEAASTADVMAWTECLDDQTIPAGAAELFDAVLRARGHVMPKLSPSSDLTDSASALFVCGSTSSYTHRFCGECEGQGIPVLRMPIDLFDETPQAGSLIQEWADAAVKALKGRRSAVVAIDRPLRHDRGVSQRLVGLLGELTEQVVRRHPVDELFVEGGETAVTVVRRLGWDRLRVCQELAPGVVRLLAEGLEEPRLTMKPGSYSWPSEVFKLGVQAIDPGSR